MSADIVCDVLIVGGSAGGTAAALAAAESGASVCLLEETDWLGGQLTTQGVCTPDEQAHIETFGGTRRYYAFRNAARDHYRTKYRLTPEAQARPHLNPGACWVSRLSYEPKAGAAILWDMAQPFMNTGGLQIFFRTRAVGCEMDTETGKRIVVVTAQSDKGELMRFLPCFVLDATDTGDLLPLCGREGEDWTVGAESRTETGEPDAPEEARPYWVQPFTFPFALEWSPETAHSNVITPPEDYEELKALQKYHIRHGAITGLFAGRMPWWMYRRVLAKENFDDPRVPADLAMINTAGNDFYGGNIIGYAPPVSQEAKEPLRPNEATAEATLKRARRASLGYVYWLQTECPREAEDLEALTSWGFIASGASVESSETEPIENRKSKIENGAKGYPEFRLKLDVFDTPDGCSIRPYIRESRRIRALRPVLEQEIVVKDFRGNPQRGDRSRAELMPDTIGVGHYALDIHPNGHGEPNHYVATRPFQIPLGALIPVRLENLLPACKNLGTTHLTNGAYRLHPIEWNIGESAGLLASFCLRENLSPRAVYADRRQQRRLQTRLLDEGIALHWFVDVPLEHPAFEAVQQMACEGIPLDSATDLHFRPEEPITPEEWQSWRKAVSYPISEDFSGTRAEAVLRLYRAREIRRSVGG